MQQRRTAAALSQCLGVVARRAVLHPAAALVHAQACCMHDVSVACSLNSLDTGQAVVQVDEAASKPPPPPAGQEKAAPLPPANPDFNKVLVFMRIYLTWRLACKAGLCTGSSHRACRSGVEAAAIVH